MKFLKRLFCKHEFKHRYNLMFTLDDTWPCYSDSVHQCDKCGKEKLVRTIIGK